MPRLTPPVLAPQQGDTPQFSLLRGQPRTDRGEQ